MSAPYIGGMQTLHLFAQGLRTVPATAAWYLADLGEARDRQELYTRQSPQRLLVLREHALVESAVFSNRLEGVEVGPQRTCTLVFGQPLVRNRDEEQVRGYRDALSHIHYQRPPAVCRGHHPSIPPYGRRADLGRRAIQGPRRRHRGAVPHRRAAHAVQDRARGSESYTCLATAPIHGTRGEVR